MCFPVLFPSTTEVEASDCTFVNCFAATKAVPTTHQGDGVIVRVRRDQDGVPARQSWTLEDVYVDMLWPERLTCKVLKWMARTAM